MEVIIFEERITFGVYQRARVRVVFIQKREPERFMHVYALF